MFQFMGPGETSWSAPKATVRAAGSIRGSKVKTAAPSAGAVSSLAAVPSTAIVKSAAASASSTAIATTTTPVASPKTNVRKQSDAKKSSPAAGKSGGGSSEGAVQGAASVKGKRKKKGKRVSVEGDSTLSGVKRARSPGVMEEGTEAIARAGVGTSVGTGMETDSLPETSSLVRSPSKGGRPRSKSPAASSASWRGMYWSAGSPTLGSASGGEGGRGAVRSSRAKSGGGLPGIVEGGKSATAHKRFRIKAQKAAEGMAAQAAYEEAKRQRLPPEEAAAKLAAAAVEAAKLAAKTSSIGGNLSKHLIDLKAAEVSGDLPAYMPVCLPVMILSTASNGSIFCNIWVGHI